MLGHDQMSTTILSLSQRFMLSLRQLSYLWQIM